MADKNFRVRHGLEVDGDATLSGDLQVSGNDIKSSTGATAITLSGSDVAVAGDLTVSGNDIKSSGGTTAITLSGANVTVVGDLTVSGTTTTLDTQNLLVEDNSILLNKNEAGAGVTAGTAGIEIERGSLANVEFRWNESIDRWQSTVDGSTYISLPNQALDTTSSPTFAGVTGGNIQVGVTGDNEIDTSTGNLTIDSAGGTTTIDDDLTVSGDVQIQGGDLTTNQTTFNLLNTTATTLNIGGAATTIEIGAATGTTNINNSLDVDGDVNIDGGDLTVSTATFNLANTNATTVNIAGAGTAVNIGAATGTTTINNANTVVTGDLAVNGGDLTTNQTTFNLLNTTATTLNVGGAGTTVSIGAATGTTTINNANTVVTGDLAVNGGDITTNQTTFNLINTTATTLNIGGGATTAVVIGNSAGEVDTPSDIQIIGNKSLRQGDGPYSGSTDIFRSNLNAALEGIQISNSGMTNAESTLVIRNYGQNYAGGSTTTQGTGNIYFGGTRGTPASPLATNNGGLISYLGTITNYGDTTGAGTGNGWSNDLYPNTAQASSTYIQAIQDHRRTAQATFTASQAGSTLTVTAVTSGTIVPGHELRRSGSVSYSVVIVRQITSTAAGNALGSTGTYQVSAASSFASQTCTTNTVSSGTQAIFSLMPTTINGTTLNAVPTAANAQNINYIPNSDGGNEVHNYRNFTIQPNWNFYPVATRIITEITGGNTLNIGTHNFTTTGASFTVTTAGNPNGLTTNTTYFIDTIPSTTTITLRTNSVSGGAVTGLTNGSNLFISAQAAAQSFTGDRNGSALILYGTRRGQNYTGATAPGSNNTIDVNRTNDSLGTIFFNGFRTTTGTIVQSTSITGRCTEDWTSATNIGSEILLNTVKTGTGTVYTTQLGASSSIIRTDSFDIINTSGTTLIDVDTSGNLIVTGDLRINGNDILASDGNTNITLTSNTLTTFAGDIRVNGNDIQNSGGTSAINLTSGNTTTTIFGDTFAVKNAAVSDIAILSRTSNDLYGTSWRFREAGGNSRITIDTPTTVGDMVMSLAAISSDGSATPTFIFDQRRGTFASPTATQNGDVIGDFKFNGYGTTTSGIGGRWSYTATENWTDTANGTNFAISAVKATTATNTNVFESNVTNTYIRGDTITLEDSTGNDYLVIDTNEAMFSKPVRTKVTTGTVAKGGTYTPAATAMNSITVEITSGSGTTYIDVNNLTVAGENGMYDILVYNNTGSQLNANDIEIINGVGNTVLQHNSAIANGARAVFEVNCIDIYAAASFMAVAV